MTASNVGHSEASSPYASPVSDSRPLPTFHGNPGAGLTAHNISIRREYGLLKGFSLTQPWATAVAILIKQWETRDWRTYYRGDVAIHASKAMSRSDKMFMLEEQTAGRLPQNVPLGVILCVATITDCRPTTEVYPAIGEIEELYGNYTPGRYAFKLGNIRVLKTPVPCKGALSFWQIPADVLQQIREQL